MFAKNISNVLENQFTVPLQIIEETEAPNGHRICLMSSSLLMAETVLELLILDCHPCTLFNLLSPSASKNLSYQWLLHSCYSECALGTSIMDNPWQHVKMLNLRPLPQTHGIQICIFNSIPRRFTCRLNCLMNLRT